MKALRNKQPKNQTLSSQQRDLASLSLAALQTRLNVTQGGLSAAEAQHRLTSYGYNELPEKRTNPLLRLLSSFWGPIPWMIEVAAILSLVVRHWADFGIILALLVMNALVGFWEEYQADTTIAALKSQLALHARVKRDGAWTTIPARELVPGDLIHYYSCNYVIIEGEVKKVSVAEGENRHGSTVVFLVVCPIA